MITKMLLEKKKLLGSGGPQICDTYISHNTSLTGDIVPTVINRDYGIKRLGKQDPRGFYDTPLRVEIKR